MKTLIISGGKINQNFLLSFMKENNFDTIIGVDKGIEMCYQLNIIPSVLMGDFDSIKESVLKKYEETDIEIKRFKPEKDDTDTQMALYYAVQIGSKEIAIVGGFGSRVDHLLGNIQSLCIPLEKNILCYMVDENNKVMLLKDSYEVKKSEQFGNYLSLLALSNEVTKLTVTGVKYPLYEYTLTNHAGGFGVSNEILKETARIEFDTGILIMIQSRDE
ncbi:thiamine diphosphokinase [Candidatus Galacturonibacter soehngenii]|uniref:Thiamine diphosphokinase n=1 Tax=Candidatus Galacturonatibacter soehngenii TaxID=2307010 RepID=A0A7V7UDN2_9FIRM|nr:thiamine diphosphokinase [Candidatus Galacturonibacter soehngenii]KAB1440716.1 thiamine diphosphokinase [Candidatus Galacturonibacter soehngenii]MBA4687476.1 thiamine diphosphokinase [Candidatus Galacturonibacter soehngenii]